MSMASSRYDQFQIKEAMIDNDIQDFLQETLESLEGRNKEDVKRNIEVLSASAAMNQELIEAQSQLGIHPVVPLEERSTAVTALALDVYGEEAYANMPGGEYSIGDIDKMVPRGDEPSTRGVEFGKIWEKAYGKEGTDFKVSQNTENLLHTKYSANVRLPSGEIECDIVRPDKDEETVYNREDTREVNLFGNLSLEVPSIPDMIVKKGTIARDNGEGFDAFRQKDLEELLALIDMAETEGIEPQQVRERCSYEQVYQIGERIEDVYPETFGGHSQEFEGPYLPSQAYAEEFMNWAV